MSNTRRPNFLVVIPDQFRRDFVASLGQMPSRTPNIDAIAARGVSFTHATTPSPQCAPARACLAAGTQYDSCGVRDNSQNFDFTRDTFYRRLRDDGYDVLTCGKLDLHKAEKNWGSDGTRLLAEVGFTGGIDSEGKLDAISSYRANGGKPAGPYMAFLEENGLARMHVHDFTQRDKWLDTNPTPLPDYAYSDNWIAEEAVRLLHGRDRETPWYLSVNCTGPHNPQDVTASMQARWKDVDFPGAYGESSVPPGKLNDIRQNYAAMVENIDSHVGRFLDILEKRGELDNTVVVFTSDHGEMLGDHDRWGKGVWYDQAIGIPMIVCGPGIRRGELSDALVQFQDLAATTLDYAGVSVDLPGSISMRPVLEGRSRESRPVAVSGLRDWRAAYDGRRKLVVSADGGVEYFDLEADPTETRDAGDHAGADGRHLSAALPATFAQLYAELG